MSHLLPVAAGFGIVPVTLAIALPRSLVQWKKELRVYQDRKLATLVSELSKRGDGIQSSELENNKNYIDYIDSKDEIKGVGDGIITTLIFYGISFASALIEYLGIANGTWTDPLFTTSTSIFVVFILFTIVTIIATIRKVLRVCERLSGSGKSEDSAGHRPPT